MVAGSSKEKTLLAPPPRPGRFDRKELLFLGALTLLGLALRLYMLDQESLWLDESYTLHTAQQGSFLDLLTGREHVRGHPAGFVIILKLWAQMWGYHPLSGRLLSVIVGTCTIPALYILCKRLFDQRAALIAALLFTMSSFHIYYSQELNSYSLLALEVTLAMLFLVRLLDSPGMKTFAAFTLLNIIALHTHLFYLFVLAAHFLAAMLFGRGRKGRLMVLLSLAITGLFFISWASTTLAGDWNSNKEYIQTHPLEFTAQRFFIILGDFIGISHAVQSGPLRGFPPQGAYVLMSVFLSIILLMRGRKNESLQMILFYFLMPVLAYNLIETIVGPFSPLGMQSRYLLIIYPAFVILLARGLAMFNIPVTAALMLVFIIPSCASQYYEYTHLTKEDWRGAAGYVGQNFSSDIPILVYPQWVDHSPRVYLLNEPGISTARFTFYIIYESRTFEPKELPEKLIVMSKKQETDEYLGPNEKMALHYLNQEYAISAKKEFFGDIEVALYTRDQFPGNDDGW